MRGESMAQQVLQFRLLRGDGYGAKNRPFLPKGVRLYDREEIALR